MARPLPTSPRVPAAIVHGALAVLLAACAAPAPSPSATPAATPVATPSPRASDPGPVGDALTVAQARAISADRVLRIRASIIVDTTAVQSLILLCDSLTKSLPPQCAGETVRVAGISPDQLDGRATFQRQGRIAWAGSIELSGKLFGNIFQVME